MEVFVSGKRYQNVEHLSACDLRLLLRMSEHQLSSFADICKNYAAERLATTSPFMQELEKTRDALKTLIDASARRGEGHG